MLKKIFDGKLVKFLIVGVLNTLVGAGIMFALYNMAGCSYWLSSAANYVVGSILSFILNKRFTFQNGESLKSTVPRFIINVAVCYVVAYGIAKPLVRYLMSGFSLKVQDNAAMLAGMVFYTSLNYFGQRFFAFKEKK
ncbi:MAG: GtrA family protein [Oscillospiraceae bacterium]|nr:GtrA family protein [Oscillospiraceae bacterium]